jgi:hypothetical protein
LPLRGSNFNNTSNGGVGYLNLNDARSNSNNNIGFRSASPHFARKTTAQVQLPRAFGFKGFISVSITPKALEKEN